MLRWVDRQTLVTPHGEFLSISQAVTQPDCPDWLRAHVTALTQGRDRAPPADFTAHLPEGRALDAHQQETATTIISGFDSLVWDEPGLGKTISAIVAANVLQPDHTLIVCPSIVKYNWQEEWHTWALQNHQDIQIIEGQAPVDVWGKVVIINYDILHAHQQALIQWRPYYTIWDEAHRLKRQEARRTRSMAAIKAVTMYTTFLSGTPLNRPIDLYPILKNLIFAHPLEACQDLRDHTKYGKRYCAAFLDRARSPYTWNDSGASNIPELRQRLRRQVMVSHPSSVSGLPPLSEEVVLLPPNESGVTESLEDQLLAHFLSTLPEDERPAQEELEEPAQRKYFVGRFTERMISDPDVAKTFEELTTYRRLCGLAKIAPAQDYIKSMREENNSPLVVFAYHKEVVQTLGKSIKGALTISGDDTAKKRADKIAKFKTGTVPVLICNSAAASEGVTLTVAHRILIIELDWNASTLSQIKHRVQRRGQTKPCRITYLLTDKTIDGQMARKVLEKAQTQRELMSDGPERTPDTGVSATQP